MITLFSALTLTLAAGLTPPASPPAGPQSVAAPACRTASAPAVAAPGLEGAEFVFSFCQADCTEGPDVSCEGTSCSAVNQNCSTGQQGHVECDGNYTFCTPCPSTGCTRFECRQGCSCPGGVSICVDLSTCECDCVYQ